MIKLLLQMMESEALKNLFLKLVNMSISASWIVLVVLILRLVLKKAPKWIPVLLWGIVAVRLICPFSIESALSLIPSTQTIPMNIEMAAKPAIDSGINAVNSVVNPIISASFTPHPGASANPLQIWIPLVAVIWCFGMALMVLYTAISYWNLCRKVDTAVRYNGNIYQSENVGSPFVLGILKPRIYLPYSMDSKSLEHVVAHEQAHIRRKDHWWKPLGFLLLTIYWFNPLMWVAYILLCRDIELACDEKVIAELGNEQRAVYTQALVACSVNRRMIAACPLAFGEVGVKDRVKSIMNYRKPAFWIIVIALVLCVVVAVCFLTNPLEDSWIKITHGAASVELECNFAAPINAYAIYEDIYENGELVSSDAIVFDNFQDEGGATPRRTEISLSVQPVNAVGGDGYTGELSVNFGGAGIAYMTRTLPKDHYTDYVHVVTEMGNRLFRKQKITTEDSVTLYSIVLSTDLLGVDHKSLVARVQNNTLQQSKDTVVIYRLITSENRKVFSSVNSSAPTGSGKTLSLNDVIMLSQKGYDLTWSDFEQFECIEYIETGFGLYIRIYEINDIFQLRIGGNHPIGYPDKAPMYMYLTLANDTDKRIDIRDGGVTDFISEYKDGAASTWDRIPMVMVDGVLYLDTGKVSTVMARCGMMDGEITSQVDGSQQPTIDNQSNFGTGYGYQYGAMEGTIEIYMNEKWWIFATEEARKEIQFPTESIESKIPDKQTVEEYVIDYTINQVISGLKKTDITILSITDQYAFVHTFGESPELLVYHYTCDNINGSINITGIVRGDSDSSDEMSINHFRMDDQYVYFGTIKLSHGQSAENALFPTERLSVKFIGESGETFEISLQDNSFYFTTLESPLESFELLDSEKQVLWDLERYLNHGYVIQESCLLIAALGTNGTRGFVKAEDLDGNLPSNPAEAVDYMEEMARKTAYGTKKYVRLIPLYDADGVTVIGEFAIG